MWMARSIMRGLIGALWADGMVGLVRGGKEGEEGEGAGEGLGNRRGKERLRCWSKTLTQLQCTNFVKGEM